MRSLPLFHTVIGQPVIVLGEGAAAEAKRRLVERAGAYVVEEDNREARLAFIAKDNPELDATRLKARGVLVNVADRPELCDFTVPSLLDRDPVLVAIGTGGASAGLAKQLRLRLEALLPPGLGKLAEALHGARDALRQRWPAADARRRALDAALAERGALDPLDPASTGRVAAWLSGAEDAAAPAEPVELTLGPDPDDLTLRQARLIGTADCLVIEPGISSAVLARARADAVRLDYPSDAPFPPGLTVVLRTRRA